MIDSQGYIKVTDFGFAKKITNDTKRTYTLCGTPEFLAPEILQGNNMGYGFSVDWWSLGVLLFEMLTGFSPFYDQKPYEIYKKILNGKVNVP